MLHYNAQNLLNLSLDVFMHSSFMVFSSSSSLLLIEVPQPPPLQQSIDDLRADTVPHVLSWFGVVAGLFVVFWIVRSLSSVS
jgi:hypothetical protein